MKQLLRKPQVKVSSVPRGHDNYDDGHDNDGRRNAADVVRTGCPIDQSNFSLKNIPLENLSGPDGHYKWKPDSYAGVRGLRSGK